MPFKSEQQRKYMWKMHPDIARKWESKYNTGGRVDKLLSSPSLSDANREALWDMKISTGMNEGGKVWDRQVFIRKLLETVKPGSKDEAILLRKLGVKPNYRQEGGNIARAVVDNAFGLGGKDNVANAVAANAFPSAAAALNQKTAQARAAGVPESEISKVLKNNAMKSRDASQRAALLQAAGTARDATSRDQAGLITQAGLPNQAYTPQGGAGAAIGTGLAKTAEAEAQYQRDLSQIDRDEQARQDKLAAEKKAEFEKKSKEQKKTDEEVKSLKKIIQLATNAHNLVAAAAPAIYVAQDAERDPTLRGATIAGIAAGGDAGAVKDFVQQYILPAVARAVEDGTIEQSAEQAYTNMVADITDLTTVALAAQGSGPKTDFDFIVAARATANLQSTPETIRGSMKRMVTNANAAMRQLEQTPIQSGLKDAPIPTRDQAGVTASAAKAPQGTQDTYTDDFNIGDKFADEAGVTYEFTSEGTLTQTSAGSINDAGTTYSGNYIRFNQNGYLEVYSLGSWYRLFKVGG